MDGADGGDDAARWRARLDAAVAIKHQGNTFFEKREYTDALKAYTQAFAMVRDEVVEYDSSMKGLVLASMAQEGGPHSSWNTRPVRSMSTTPELRAVSAKRCPAFSVCAHALSDPHRCCR